MLIIPELALVVGGLVLLMIGVFTGEKSGNLVTLLTILLLVGVGGALAMPVTTSKIIMNGAIVQDGFGQFMKLLCVLGAVLSLVMGRSFILQEKMNKFEFPVLVLFATIGMVMMISANDFLSLYVGLELQSLSLYVLAAFRRDSLKATEAGLKYFVLGALSSGLLLYGISLVYGFSGGITFDHVASAFSGNGPVSLGVIIGLVFVISGLAFKISAVPFHMWTPDVYEGAPTPVTAFFSLAPKVAAMALLTRVLLGPFGPLMGQWQQVIVVMAVASMVVGSFAAIAQTNIKRLMAYSSIGHMGFLLVALAAGGAGAVEAISAYLAIYLAMGAGTFCVILAMRRDGQTVENIRGLAGLARTHPFLAACMAIFMFSMAGIPPLAGFFGKMMVFQAAVSAGLFGLAVIGVVASVVSAFYYLRIVKIMYFDEGTGAFDKPFDLGLSAVLVGTSAVTLLFVAFPTPILDAAKKVAASLVGG
jgi:NADH-quinone oxidoreductase subunit N